MKGQLPLPPPSKTKKRRDRKRDRRSNTTTRLGMTFSFTKFTISILLFATLYFTHTYKYTATNTQSIFVTAFDFKLSSLLGYYFGEDDNNENFVRPVFQRRDLVKELGSVERYEALVSKALLAEQKEEQRDATTTVCTDEDNEQQCTNQDVEDGNVHYYEMDTSFPTHYLSPSPNTNSRSHYDNFLEECMGYYSPVEHLCEESERDRIDRNLNQPPVMQNYTMFGFQKMRAPKGIMNSLTEFWEANKKRKVREIWSTGDTHTNHWSSPTYMLSVDNPELYGGGVVRLKNAIWEAARTTLQQWISTENPESYSYNNQNGGASTKAPFTLSPSSLYGIRVYGPGSILAPHVDRLPLVTSAIINVAQDVDEPWPLEIYGHDGNAYNVTLEPGDMLLYESHSVIHGRPYPLKGRYYANIFIHFEPAGHCERHAARMNGEEVVDPQEDIVDGSKRYGDDKQPSAEALYKRTKEATTPPKDVGIFDTLPFYIIGRDMMNVKRWSQELKYTRFNSAKIGKLMPQSKLSPTGAHSAASIGDLEVLMEYGKTHPHWLDQADDNDWTPLHEAARGGHVECVEYLLKQGVDMNKRTNAGKGGSPLWWAKNRHDESHPAYLVLKKAGAKEIAPDFD